MLTKTSSSEVARRLDNLDAQALANLADSLPALAPQLVRRLEPTIDIFVSGMPLTLDGWSKGPFLDTLQRVFVDNFGAAGTRTVFSHLGVIQPPSSFTQTANHRIMQVLSEGDLRKDTFGLAHKRVLCYAEWDILLNTGEPLRGALLQENGIRVGHTAPPSWLRSFPTPINYLIGRDLCGEFQLVTGIALILDALPSMEMQGSVYIFSSATPCVSCVAVVRQFQQRFSSLQFGFVNGEQQ